MAWLPLGNVIICIFLLSSLPQSHQRCPNAFNFKTPFTEGPTSLGHKLGVYGNDSILNLTLTDDAGGYLAINVSATVGQGSTFTLYIAKEVDLETLKSSTLTGHVICADGDNSRGYGNSTVIAVVAGLNEFPPEFNETSFSTTVREDASVHSTVYDLSGKAVDPDYPPANQILYEIHNNSSLFSITNGHEVILNHALDFDTGPASYILNISAEELQPDLLRKTSYATLTINIEDVDDLGPKFSHNATYTLALPEGVYDGTIVNTDPVLAARDGDSLQAEVQLVLDPTSESLANRVTILSNGSLQVQGKFEPGHITLNVRAVQTNRQEDRFAIASVLVTVYDVNDHSPVMSSSNYSASVLEGAGFGAVVLTVSASDDDQGINGSFQFYLNESSVPFSISTHSTVGIVTLSGSVDRETRPSYLLHVYAQEELTAEKRRSNMSEVYITVLDANDNSPVFQGTPYHFYINKTHLAGTAVGQVNATDEDSGSNGQVAFSIVATHRSNGSVLHNLFSVDPSTGVITLTTNLTQQDVGVVFLDIQAADNASLQHQRSQSTRVTVSILPVNKHAPVFTQTSYNFSVAETAQKGDRVGSIRATDQDNDHLTYNLISGPNVFSLEGDPPSLLVNGSLDLDTGGAQMERTLEVTVTDGAHQSTATVTVLVTPVNEFPPVLAQSDYVTSVKENATLGDHVLMINATDGDSGTDGELSFTITSPSESERGPFAINSTTGVLSLLHCNHTSCLSYSRQQYYSLVVRVSDGGRPPKSAYCTVRVNVEDVNNQPPSFSSRLFSGTVSEDAPSGTTVLVLHATDEDTAPSHLQYSLEAVNPAGWLTVKENDVVTNGSLDAETTRYVTATVVVSDGVQTDSAEVNITVLDVNDNSPQITLPSNPVHIPENATVGTSVLNVTAHDRDVTQGGSFLFFLGPSAAGKFDIGMSTGEITVAAPFDRRLQKEYDMVITVSDNSAPPKLNSTTLHVVITDSNSAPVFVDSSNSSVLLYTFNVSEEEPVGFVLGSVRALDPDSGSSGQITYTISSGDQQDTFLLDQHSGQLSLRNRVDFEQKSSYSFTVTATDHSYEPKNDTATVWVQISDVVEAPQWPEALPTVHLSASRQCDMQLNARPQDIVHAASRHPAEVVYTLLNHTDLFEIQNDTGLLRKKKQLNPATYVLGLQACSALNETVCATTTLTVIVSPDDVIAFCPPFLTVHVNESEAIGHVVADLNTTQDDTNITYVFKDGSLLPFVIDPETGIITVNGTLDREATSRYTLDVLARFPPHGSESAQVTVVIDDAQDTPPSFQLQRYDGQINEAAHVGDPVLTIPTQLPLRVVAEDKDLDSVLSYSVVAEEDSSKGAFSVNASTGEVTLHTAIDRENMTANSSFQFTLTVMVTDGIYNDNATVVITVLNDNDNSPVFDSDVLIFNVSEAQEPPFTVGVLSATDQDEGDTENLRYSLLSSLAEPFALSSSGVLQLTGKLDRETESSYNFTVQATDPGKRNGTAQVFIQVLDANEAPQFGQSTYFFNITEGPGGLPFVRNLTAVDGDLGTNAILTFHIVDGNLDNAFSMSTVDNATGVLRLVKELDREARPSLTLTVTATDAGQPSMTGTCRVEVKVMDVNDHDPVWVRDRYKAVVSESASNNTQVLLIPQASVTDADEGIFGVAGMVYSLEPAYPEVPFRVDAATGDIFVIFNSSSNQLDREARSSYVLMLEATDELGRGRKANSTVVVNLLNVNDHPPAFNQTSYTFHVREDAPVGWRVAKLFATDSDNNNNDDDNNNNGSSNSSVDEAGGGLLRYYLHPPGGSGLFYLEPVSGELQVSGPLDRETKDRYVLSLGVYDGLFWGSATAEIMVEDVNDNCPDFNTRDPLKLKVMENQDPLVIYVFNVTDSDVGRNADVTLFLNDTEAQNYLRLSPNGTLATTRRLDREKADQQTLTFAVWARDGGDPACVRSVRVEVEVAGDNEEVPVVCQITAQQRPVCGGVNITVTAFEGDPAGTFLAALTWRDSDEGEGGQATLSIEDDPETLLALNQSSSSPTTRTSLLILARPLDDRAGLATRGALGEDNSTYRAVVRVVDGGQRPRNSSVAVVLKVLQRSPSTPHFSASVYHFAVKENQPASVIGRVEASTGNSQMSMTYAVQSALFTVDNKGNISTTGQLDRERADQHTFLVLAWESSQPSETATTVVLVQVEDMNDNAPEFSGGARYALTVPENLKNVSLLTFQATDRDAGRNGQVTFSLLNDSSYDGVFALNETSGQLRLTQSLDRETKSFYVLRVQVQDGGVPAESSQTMVELTVTDLNDNEPTFALPDYVAYVDENAPAATLVKTVTATDADFGLNGQVLYELVTNGTAGSVPPSFFINEFSGAVYTARSLHFSAEQSFNLTVRARDLGSPPRTSEVPLQVLVNDLSTVLPQVRLDPDTVALVLGTPPGTPLPVNVSGGNGVYNFSFVGGNEEGMFSIDSESGEVRVVKEVEKITTFRLVIRVLNLQAPQYHSDGTLTVRVASVKLEQEQYAAVVPENRPPPFLLLDINSNAERAGVPVIYLLQGNAIAGVFSIGAGTGQVFCNSSLDREHRAQYTMTVSVRLAQGPSTSTAGRRRRALGEEAEIRVIVDDVNDNAPRFDVTSNFFGIPSSAPANTIVTTLKAKDPDAGTNGEVVYTATGGDTNVFYVTSGGEVTSLEAMTGRKSGEQFQLSVTATDNGGDCGTSANSATCQTARIDIKIVVVPNNDRFGLVANITVGDFVNKQQFYLRNLSAILNLTLQLDKVEPHQGATVDTTRSDIYFYAFDTDGKPVPYTTVDERVKDNAAAIHALFRLKSVELIPVTQPPTRVRVETRSAMGEAEVAVIVVASLIFLGSFVAIILTIKAWRKQKEFQRREEAAVRARQKLEQEARELADKIQETSFVADPEEPLELYRPAPAVRPVVTEVQECVMNFDNESTGVDTLVLRRDVLQRTEARELEALITAEGKSPGSSSGDSGMENPSDSLSSEEHSKRSRKVKASPMTAPKESRQPSTSKSPTLASDRLSSTSSVNWSPKLTSAAPKNKTSSSSVHPLGTLERTQKLDLNANVRTETAERLQHEKVIEQMLKNVSEKTQNGTIPKDKESSNKQDIGEPHPCEDLKPKGATDKEDHPEDPEPDYQKRVSFGNVLDPRKDIREVKENTSNGTAPAETSKSSLSASRPKVTTNGLRNESETNYLSATSKLLDSLRAKNPSRAVKVSPLYNAADNISKELGFVNQAYQADDNVLDGWAEDYDRRASASPRASTAL